MGATMGRLRYGARAAGLLAALLLPGAAHAADLLFQAEAQTLTGTCTGQAVRVEGNHNHVTLTGPCRSLLLKGVANTLTLTLAAGGTIRVEGSENRVRYASLGASSVIEAFGPGNEVTAGEPARPTAVAPAAPLAAIVPPKPLPPTPAPLVTAAKSGPLRLSGDDEARLADCNGRDVLVAGSRSSYVIRGACRSLDVRGDLLTVQAVLQSGARIAVTGRGSVVSWDVPGKGRAPAAIVRGVGSRVQRAQTIGGEPPPR